MWVPFDYPLLTLPADARIYRDSLSVTVDGQPDRVAWTYSESPLIVCLVVRALGAHKDAFSPVHRRGYNYFVGFEIETAKYVSRNPQVLGAPGEHMLRRIEDEMLMFEFPTLGTGFWIGDWSNERLTRVIRYTISIAERVEYIVRNAPGALEELALRAPKKRTE